MSAAPQPGHDTVIDVTAAVEELLGQAREGSAGRAARTLTPGAGAALKQTLMALTGGTVLADHESPGEATLYVLTGTVRLTSAGADLLLDAGAYAPIPRVRHGVQCIDDAVVLISVAAEH